MANLFYNNFYEAQGTAGINLLTDTIKVALVTSTYVPDPDTHEFFSSVTNQVVGTGYTAGGATLASKTLVQDNTLNQATFDAADVTWATSTITARGAVIYKDTGVAGTSPLIHYYDFVTDQVSSAGDFLLQWNASGVLVVKAAA